MNLEQLIKARGEIVQRFVNIEWFVKLNISQHYLGRPDNDFMFKFLSNDQASFGLVRKVFVELMGDEIDQETVSKLGRLNKIRNYFAHLGIKSDGTPERPDAELFLYPGPSGSNIDPQKEYDDFMGLYGPMIDWLRGVSEKKGVTYTPSEG